MTNANRTTPSDPRIILGAASGAYTWGLVTGLFDGLGWHDAVGLAGHTLLAGLLTGVAAAQIFRWLEGEGAVRSVTRFALVGTVFFGLSSVLLPPYAAEVPFYREPVAAAIGGFGGGGVTGLLLWLFRRG